MGKGTGQQLRRMCPKFSQVTPLEWPRPNPHAPVPRTAQLWGTCDIGKGPGWQGLAGHTMSTYVRACGLPEWDRSLLPGRQRTCGCAAEVHETLRGGEKHYFLIHKKEKLMSEK